MDPETLRIRISFSIRYVMIFEWSHTGTWMVFAGFMKPSNLLCEYLHFMEWSRKTFRDYPKSDGDT